jgi:hypothetical protein
MTLANVRIAGSAERARLAGATVGGGGRNRSIGSRSSFPAALATPGGKEEHVMNGAFLVATAAALAGLTGYGMRAQDAQDLTTQEDSPDAGVFSRWLAADGPECVPVSQIGSVSQMTKLTPEQFQFVRVLYVAIPPVSRQLPPGDSAVVASASGKSMIALVADGQACARFLAPDFVLSMLVEVGRGEVGMIGEPI